MTDPRIEHHRSVMEAYLKMHRGRHIDRGYWRSVWNRLIREVPENDEPAVVIFLDDYREDEYEYDGP